MTDDLLSGFKKDNDNSFVFKDPLHSSLQMSLAVTPDDQAEKVEVNLFQQDLHHSGKETLSRASLLPAVNRMTTWTVMLPVLARQACTGISCLALSYSHPVVS